MELFQHTGMVGPGDSKLTNVQNLEEGMKKFTKQVIYRLQLSTEMKQEEKAFQYSLVDRKRYLAQDNVTNYTCICVTFMPRHD